jgi:hypothetical protein
MVAIQVLHVGEITDKPIRRMGPLLKIIPQRQN